MLGDITVEFAFERGRCRLSAVRSTAGVPATVTRCVRGVGTRIARRLHVEVPARTVLTRDAPLGTPRPLLPDVRQLVADWGAPSATGATPARPGPQLKRALPPFVLMQANGCLGMTATPTLSASLALWLSSAGREIPFLVGAAFAKVLAIPPYIPRYFWLDGGWILGVTTAETSTLCLWRTDNHVLEAVREKLDEAGTCWLGSMSDIVARPAVALPSGRGFRSVSANSGRTCGVDEAGDVVCCGAGARNMGRKGPFTEVSVGGLLICALRTDQTLECWSDEGTTLAVPQGRFLGVRATLWHACAIDADRQVVCWAKDSSRLSSPAGSFRKVVATEIWSHVLSINGAVVSWNNGRQLERPGPFIDVEASQCQVCATDDRGAVTCWNEVAPTAQPKATNLRDIVVGCYFGCGLRPDGRVMCWGNIETPPSGRFLRLGASEDYACGVRANGDVQCWGRTWPEADVLQRRYQP
jgi:hypothetical protein